MVDYILVDNFVYLFIQVELFLVIKNWEGMRLKGKFIDNESLVGEVLEQYVKLIVYMDEIIEEK